MTALIQFTLGLILFAITSWLVGHWIGFIGDAVTAAAIGFPIMLLIAWLVDQRQERLRRRESQVTIEHER